MHEGECQTDNHTADVHVIRSYDVMNGIRSDPREGDFSLEIRAVRLTI